MFDAGAISGKVGLDISPYAQGMLQAQSIARQFPPIVGSFIAAPLLAATEILGGFARSIAGAFSEATSFADDMGDLAESVGVSVEGLTSLGAVAAQAGASVETVADSYRFLGRSIAEAVGNRTSEAAKTFRALGIAVTDAGGNARPLEEVMIDLADAIARLPAGAQRTSLAMELLGRGGTAMVPTLAQGSSALREQMRQMDAYGATVTRRSQQASDVWQDSMGEIGLAWRGLKQSFVEPIRDALLPYLSSLLGWVRENQPIIRARIAEVIDAVLAAPRAVGEAFSSIRSAVGLGMSWIGGVVQRLGERTGITELAITAFTGAWRMLSPAVTIAGVAFGEVLATLTTLRSVIRPGMVEAIERLRSLVGSMPVFWEMLLVSLRSVIDVIRGTLIPVLSIALVAAWERAKSAAAVASTVFMLSFEQVKLAAQAAGTILSVALEEPLKVLTTAVTAFGVAWDQVRRTIEAVVAAAKLLASIGFAAFGGGSGNTIGAASAGASADLGAAGAEQAGRTAGVGVRASGAATGPISLAAPPIDPDRMGVVLASHLEPVVEQRIREAEAGAKAARYAAGVRGRL